MKSKEKENADDVAAMWEDRNRILSCVNRNPKDISDAHFDEQEDDDDEENNENNNNNNEIVEKVNNEDRGMKQ